MCPGQSWVRITLCCSVGYSVRRVLLLERTTRGGLRGLGEPTRLSSDQRAGTAASCRRLRWNELEEALLSSV